MKQISTSSADIKDRPDCQQLHLADINIMSLRLNEANINEFGRYEELKKTVDKAKAKAYFENTEFVRLSPPKVNIKVDNLLREFILSGGFDIKPAIHILDTSEVTEQMVAEGDMEYGHK